MAITITIPYKTVVGPTGIPWTSYAPVVDSLPISPVSGKNILVLSNDVGSYAAGLYYYGAPARWQFALPYTSIADNLFGIAEIYLALTFTGDTQLHTGDIGAATPVVYRNGVRITDWVANPGGVLLTRASLLNDYYTVILVSPIDATTPAGGPGGITDVPNDDQAYIRRFGSWETTADMMASITVDEGPY